MKIRQIKRMDWWMEIILNNEIVGMQSNSAAIKRWLKFYLRCIA